MSIVLYKFTIKITGYRVKLLNVNISHWANVTASLLFNLAYTMSACFYQSVWISFIKVCLREGQFYGYLVGISYQDYYLGDT